MVKARRGGRAGGLVVAAALGVSLWSASASAGPLDIFGLSARSMAMGGAMTGDATDFSSLYYNMAGMVHAEPNVGMGLLIGLDDVNVRLKARPPGYDLPDLGQSAAAIPSRYRLRARQGTEDIPDTYGFFIGAVSSLGIKGLRVGGMAYLPVNRLGLQQTHFADEREQYFSNSLDFELLGGRSQHQVVIVGAAYALTEWLSVGGGLSFLPSTAGTNYVYIDNPTDQSNVQVALNQEQKGNVAPHAGLMLGPVEGWRVGLSYRGENHMSVDVENEVQIRGFQESEGGFPVIQQLPNALAYSPHQLALGVSSTRGGLTWSADVTWSLWSRYLNNQSERGAGFEDTFTPRLGVEYPLYPWFTLRSGAAYEASPVPAQTGRTNYVDNSRLIISLGSGHPLELFDAPVEVSWVGQLHYLVPRDTQKAVRSRWPSCTPGERALCDELPDDAPDPVTGQPVPEHAGLQTGNPGFPGFSSGGLLLALSLDLRWRF